MFTLILLIAGILTAIVGLVLMVADLFGRLGGALFWIGIVCLAISFGSMSARRAPDSSSSAAQGR